MHAQRTLTTWLSLLCLVAIATLSSVAHAQATDLEKRVKTMNKQAMADYDSLEFDMARTTLLDAVALVRQNGIGDSAVAARTYMNLGVVFVSGFKDRNRGLQQFVAALRINPQAHLDPSSATPELEEVFAAAKKQVGNASTPTPTPTPTPKQPVAETPDDVPAANDVKGLAHTAPDEVPANLPLTLKAQLGSDTGAVRVFIMYRSSGQADYVAIPMQHTTGAEWAGQIPGQVMDRPIQYYLEARDKRGRPVIGSGSAPNPYIVTIAEVAPGARVVHREAPPKEKSKFHHMFVFLMPGFGLGYHPAGNRTEIAYQNKGSGGATMYEPTTVQSPGGVAIAPFHLSVEVGGLITNHFSLSVLGRFEVVTGANAQTQPNGMPLNGASTRASGAVAGFVRARYRFLEGKVHPYVHIDIGGGEIRHALNLSNAQKSSGQLVDAATASTYNSTPNTTFTKQGVCPAKGTCYDSLKMGNLFIGGGAGVWYDVQKYVGLILDVNVLGGIGVGSGGQSGMNIDFQLGLGVHFL